MRVRSLQALAELPMSISAKRQLEAEFQSRKVPKPTSQHAEQPTSTLANEAKALQSQLWLLINSDDELKRFTWQQDYVGAVPHRKFELDMCIPEYAIGCELDGWSFHGKHKRDFLRDREKDYLLSIQGWQVYRLEAGLLYKDPSLALRKLREYLQIWIPRQKLLIGKQLVPQLDDSVRRSNDDDPSE